MKITEVSSWLTVADFPDADKIAERLQREIQSAAEMLTVSVPDLAAAIRAELAEFFHDGVYPTLGEWAFDHIVGGVIQRVAGERREDPGLSGAQ